MSAVFPVADDPRWRKHTASAGQTVFPIPYVFQDAADVTIEKVGLDGARTTLSRPADYSVSGAGNPAGGSYTLVAPAAAGEIYISTGTAVGTRTQSVVRDGRFASGPLDDDLDRALIRDLELRRDVDRSLKLDLLLGPLQPGHFLVANEDGDLVDGGNGADIAAAGANALAAVQAAASAESDADRAEAARDVAEATAANSIGPLGEPWNAAVSYAAGLRVEHNASLWYAVVANINVEPGTDSSTWLPAAAFPAGYVKTADRTTWPNLAMFGNSVGSSSSWSSIATTDIIPLDNTQPLSNEGVSILSGTWYPQMTTSLYYVEGFLPVYAQAAGTLVVALFNGTTCIGAAVESFATGEYKIVRVQSAGLLQPSSLTGKVLTLRAGNSASGGTTFYRGGNNANALFNGLSAAGLNVYEMVFQS